ncbi:MAG: RluA family pseudouridine synthase [Eubacteriales bacterium]|jgi:23S rRNA pseudouridine1911/1915/1917 synthase
MERTFTFKIEKEDTGQDIHSFLRRKGFSRHILQSMKPDPTSILLNGRHEFMCHPLEEGDVLTARVCDPVSSENIIPAPVPFGIAYEDEDILVVNKPANLAIHPAISHPENTLGNGVVWYYEKQGIPFVFRCINRLDRDTTGLLIVAKNIVASCILEQSLQRHEIHRTYLAVAEGMCDESGTVDLPIGRQDRSLIERCVDLENGERAVTHYRRLKYIPDEKISRDNVPGANTPSGNVSGDDVTGGNVSGDNVASGNGSSDNVSGDNIANGNVSEINVPGGRSVLQLRLETGRTHQIRVHMAYLGHPLVGDTLYNPAYLRRPTDPVPADAPIGRQALHSWKLDFVHPITKKAMHLEAPIPGDMQALIDG